MKQEIQIAITGNPNVGKTSLFNALSGLNQKVGNWPGVTVEKKEGFFEYGDNLIHLIDLPGIYDLRSYSLDEKVSEEFLLTETPDLILYVADATKLSRSLFLAVEILEMGLPMILCLNLSDIAFKKGIQTDIQKLSNRLGVQVIQTNARENQGIEGIKKLIGQKIPFQKNRKLFQYEDDKKNALEPLIQSICLLLEGSRYESRSRYLAIKILEIPSFLDSLELSPEISEKIKGLAFHPGTKFSGSLETLITEKRYAFSHGIALECSKSTLPIEKKLDLSDKLDRIATHKYLGIPIFLGIMWLMFQAVFQIGNPLSEVLRYCKNSLLAWISGTFSPNLLTSFVSQGLLEGVGSVIVLLPNILILFLFMAILEDSGYMPRAAFVMDSFMHRFKLHGKSFIPMILGFGCNVPAIMSARIIENRNNRLLTILISPFISCSARLPVYILFTSVFFPHHQGFIVFSLYLLGIITAILSANLFKRIFFREEVLPLIIELPFYQMPSFKKMILHMWEKSKIYIKKAGTIILFGTLIIWLLASIPFGIPYGSQESLLAKIGQWIAPAFSPAGFGFWQASVALLFGVVAKETVVSTMGTLLISYGTLEAALGNLFTPLSAYSFLVMTLLYVPCLATIAAMKQESNLKWTAFGISYSLAVGWGLSVLVFQIGKLFI